MKRFSIYILSLLAMVLSSALVSCSESNEEDTEFSDWQTRNEQYFDQKYSEVKALVDAGNTEWKILRKWSYEGNVATHSYDHILVNVLKEGNGAGCPLSTDTVDVHYSGRLIPSESYSDGYVFDQSWTGEFNEETAKPSTFAVTGTVVDGFSTLLQYMHIGDKWRVYIPYQLAYGKKVQGSVPAYSTLIFDVELVHYRHANNKTKASVRRAK